MKTTELIKYLRANCSRDGDKYVYINGKILLPSDIKFRDIKQCKYSQCVNFTKEAKTYCCNGCSSDDYDYQRIYKGRE